MSNWKLKPHGSALLRFLLIDTACLMALWRLLNFESISIQFFACSHSVVCNSEFIRRFHHRSLSFRIPAVGHLISDSKLIKNCACEIWFIQKLGGSASLISFHNLYLSPSLNIAALLFNLHCWLWPPCFPPAVVVVDLTTTPDAFA